LIKFITPVMYVLQSVTLFTDIHNFFARLEKDFGVQIRQDPKFRHRKKILHTIISQSHHFLQIITKLTNYN